ncbi:metallophosphoesterase [Streptomyces cavernae]|uniref:metallophosphoesterase n=1 Tax=Streptomyces cavernae TaxID=2259034 RepID=UPI000FEBA2C1|nr:metallophosphoesterase [Streptomyces cavernae]
MVIVFILAVLAAFGALHWYAWGRLFRDTTRGPGWVRRSGAIVVAGGPLLMVAAFVAERGGAPFTLQQILAWPGFLWLALSLYLLLGLLAGELVRPVLRRLAAREKRTATVVREAVPAPGGPAPEQGRASGASAVPGIFGAPAVPGTSGAPTVAAGSSASGVSTESAVATETSKAAETSTATEPPAANQPAEPAEPAQPVESTESTESTEPAEPVSGDAPGDLTRRLFVSRVIAGAAAAVAVGTVGYGTYGVLRGPKVKRVTVPLAKLPRAAQGYRIAVVSDIHLGPVLGRGFAQKVVDTINATQPDLIAVVGDLVDGSVEDLSPAAAPLAQLKARHGAFFVTGNHEYFSGAEQWVEHVRELGLRPLENDRTELPYFDLAGVNDVAGDSEGDGPDFAKALGDRDRARTAVLLAHQPVVIHDAVRHGVDLQLSGHTHGGQLWPGNFVADLANPTLAGLERYGDTQLYVTRGAGAWGPPVRVGAPSDITVVELASRQA